MSLQRLKWEKLPSIGLLAGLTPEELALLNGCGSTINARANETLIREGQQQDRLYVVLEGRVRISCVKEAAPVVIAEIREGEIFGEMAVIDPDRASATVETTTNSELWFITRDDFYRLVGENKEIGVKMLFGLANGLVKRVRDLNREIPACRGEMTPL